MVDVVADSVEREVLTQENLDLKACPTICDRCILWFFFGRKTPAFEIARTFALKLEQGTPSGAEMDTDSPSVNEIKMQLCWCCCLVLPVGRHGSTCFVGRGCQS